ncbi:MAG: MEKHLA domain-containing protein [Cyanobacteria bacterium J06641_5]
MFPAPAEANQYLAEHIAIVRDSYRKLLGRDLLSASPSLSGSEAARAIWEAPFMVVSHDTAADPIFNYANQATLKLFAMTWEEFTALPSRQSAEPPTREERAHLLAQVTANGFVENYSGIRIAKTGQRFEIRNVTVWNLTRPNGTYVGQAATYSDRELRFL